jgi:type I restriction enzyme M protein
MDRCSHMSTEQVEAHLWGAASILCGRTTRRELSDYILSLLVYKHLCDEWDWEVHAAILEFERQRGYACSEEKAAVRESVEHRFSVPSGSTWSDVKASTIEVGKALSDAMRMVATANDNLEGAFCADWSGCVPGTSGERAIPDEIVSALLQHFDKQDLSSRSVQRDVLGGAALRFRHSLLQGRRSVPSPQDAACSLRQRGQHSTEPFLAAERAADATPVHSREQVR